MRRHIALVLAVALLIALTGCHKEMDAREEAERQARLAELQEQQRQQVLQRQQQQAAAQAAAQAGSGTGSNASGGSGTGTGTGGGSQGADSNTAGGGTGQQTAATPPAQALPLDQDNLAPGDVALLGMVTYTVTSTYLVKQAPSFPAGYGFVLVEVQVKNEGTSRFTVNSIEHFILTDQNGKAYKLNATAWGQRSPKLQGTLEPGQETKGWLGYMLKVYNGEYSLTIAPPDWGTATFKFSL